MNGTRMASGTSPLVRRMVEATLPLPLPVCGHFAVYFLNFNPLFSSDGTAHICDVSKLDFNTNLSPMLTYTGHQSSVNCVKFHHNNDLMLTASGDGTAQIWRFNPEQVCYDRT